MTECIMRKARRVSIVARILGTDKSTIHRMIDRGELEFFWLGNRKQVYIDSVIKYQRERQIVADDIE